MHRGTMLHRIKWVKWFLEGQRSCGASMFKRFTQTHAGPVFLSTSSTNLGCVCFVYLSPLQVDTGVMKQRQRKRLPLMAGTGREMLHGLIMMGTGSESAAAAVHHKLPSGCV